MPQPAGRALVVLAALILVAAGGFLFYRALTPAAPGLVVVSVAGLRADALEEGPLAAFAAREDVARALTRTPSPSTLPALAGLLTGQHPASLGFRYGDLDRLPSDARSQVELLAREGVATALFSGQGQLSVLSGLARGFAEVETPSRPFDQALLPEESAGRMAPPRAGYLPAPVVAARALEWISAEERGDAPYFALVHFGDPALALSASGEPRDNYAVALERVAAALGELASGLAERAGAALLVVSLHGEALGEEGELRHGLGLSRSTVEVPLLALGLGEKSRRALEDSATLAELLAPLLEERFGVEAPDHAPPALVSSWLPFRLFDWRAPAIARAEDGSWEPLTEERRESLGFPDGSEPDEEARRTAFEALAEARVAFLEGRLDDAGAALERATARAPSAPAPRLLRIELLLARSGGTLREEQRPIVEEDLRVLSEGATTPARRLDLARALFSLERKPEALELASGIAEGAEVGEEPGVRFVAADLVAALGAVESAVALVEPLAEREGARSPELFEWLGDRLARSGNAFRARVAYERALETPRARNANLVAKLGDQLAALGETDAALQAYARALEMEPGYRYPHARAGEVLLASGQEGAAVHAFVQSVPESGRPIEDALRRAQALSSRGLVVAALNELAPILEAHPNAFRAHSRFAALLADVGKLDEATTRLEQVVAARPEEALPRVELARVYALAERFEDALAQLVEAQPFADSELSERVRFDSAFRRAGENHALARFARSFEGGAEDPS